ncbi:MAG: ABC transporter ATP-binding protein [Candidatus Omnitrophica bacterium]|nr:ABC transporter ATP-binding protein [Candidatus Omnitrophota bacterium]
MILQVKNITKTFIVERGMFKRGAGLVRALDGVSFSMEEYSALGVVGESGSGKTTLAKIILGLIPANGGEVIFDERMIADFRKDVQIIFQNPYNSLDPKMRIINTLAEPLLIHRVIPRHALKERAIELLRMVGLDEGALSRYPIEFSGGQRQRICIARALASEPKFIVLDEPISSLDLTIQAEMLDLFLALKERFKLTYIFISHNLAVIKQMADQVIVMESGKIVEQGAKDAIFNSPAKDYTKLLLEAARGW